jgi:hypothetical protein
MGYKRWNIGRLGTLGRVVVSALVVFIIAVVIPFSFAEEEIVDRSGMFRNPWDALQSLPNSTLGQRALSGISGVFGLLDGFGSNPQPDEVSAANQDEGTGANFYGDIYGSIKQGTRLGFLDEMNRSSGMAFEEDLLSGFKLPDFFWDYATEANPNPAFEVVTTTVDAGQCAQVFAQQAMREQQQYRVLRARLLERIDSDDSFLGGLAVDDYLKRFDEATPELLSLAEAEALSGVIRNTTDCASTIEKEAAFESRLSLLFTPLEQELEVQQTFANGTLSDFQKGVGNGVRQYFNRSGFGDPGLPKYDLVFDLELVEKILFGTGVSIDSGDVAQGGSDPRNSDNTYDAYSDHLKDALKGTDDSQVGSVVLPGGGVLPIDNGSQTSTTALPSAGSAGGSRSGGAVAGAVGPDGRPIEGDKAVCPYDTGISLNFSGIGSDGSFRPIDTAFGGLDTVNGLGSGGPASRIGRAVDAAFGGGGLEDLTTQELVAELLLLPDLSLEAAQNADAECEMYRGDYLSYVFCIRVEFAKVGKTWEVERVNDSCIACQLRKLNKIIEEELLARNLRPHKNAGLIMESGICADAYSDDIGFFIDVQKVPVKFYDPICYPSAGVYPTEMAAINGHPSFVSQLMKGEMNCLDPEIAINADAKKVCSEVIHNGKMTKEQFASYYRQRDEKWAKLVGSQGIAQRRLHDFLVRMGVEDPVLDEDTKPVRVYGPSGNLESWNSLYENGDGTVNWNFQERKRSILLGLKETRGDPIGQMCWRGLLRQAADTTCLSMNIVDSLYQLDLDIFNERSRLMTDLERWKQQKRALETNATCSAFEGDGPLDTFGKFLEDRTVGKAPFYTEPKYDKGESVEGTLTRQILDNVRIGELGSFFDAFQEQLDAGSRLGENVTAAADFEAMGKHLQTQMKVMERELVTMKQYLGLFNKQWARLDELTVVVEDSPDKISVLEEFKEKIRRSPTN